MFKIPGQLGGDDIWMKVIGFVSTHHASLARRPTSIDNLAPLDTHAIANFSHDSPGPPWNGVHVALIPTATRRT